jgi:hypothetical protein
VINDGLLFRANRLCIPVGSVRHLLLQKAHVGGLVGHFDAKKMKDVLVSHFFWPKMRSGNTMPMLTECYLTQNILFRKVLLIKEVLVTLFLDNAN